MQVSVGGRLVVRIDDALAASGELDPCPPAAAGGEADLDISRQRAVAAPATAARAGDGGDGWISAFADGRLHLARRGGGACVVDGRPGELPLHVTADAALPAWALMRGVVRPLLQLGLPARGAGSVHAAAVARPGAGVLIAGWSESGKTELALALAERGWSVLADKWTVVDEQRRMAPFPVRAGIRGWVLEYLPQLRSALPLRARVRIGAAGRLSRTVERLAGAAGNPRSPLAGAAVDMTRAACAQGERLSMTLSALQELYGSAPPDPPHPPVTLVVVLRTVTSGPPVARPLSAQEALPAMHESAAYERRDALGLLLRRRFGGGDDAVQHAAAVERDLLATALADVPFVELCCRFPSDPRLIAALVESHL